MDPQRIWYFCLPLEHHQGPLSYISDSGHNSVFESFNTMCSAVQGRKRLNNDVSNRRRSIDVVSDDTWTDSSQRKLYMATSAT